MLNAEVSSLLTWVAFHTHLKAVQNSDTRYGVFKLPSVFCFDMYFLRSWATQVCAYETNLCETGHEGPEGAFSLTSALDEGCESTPRPGRFTPRNDPVLIVQEAVWAPGPVWTDTKNLAPPQGFDRSVAIPTTLSRPTNLREVSLTKHETKFT